VIDILVPQATLTSKCHSLYVALVSSAVVVIQIYSCTKLTWMDGYFRRRYTYFSHGTYGRPSYQSKNHHDSTNERSLKLRHRGCYQHSGPRYTHSLLVPFAQPDIHSRNPTYGDDYRGDGADDEHRATERASIHTIKPTVQGSRGYQDPSTTSCNRWW